MSVIAVCQDRYVWFPGMRVYGIGMGMGIPSDWVCLYGVCL